MTIYKQILESAKPAGEFGKDEQVVELNFVLGLVDSEDAKKELPEIKPEDHICGTCKHEEKSPTSYPCWSCSNARSGHIDSWEPQETEEA